MQKTYPFLLASSFCRPEDSFSLLSADPKRLRKQVFAGLFLALGALALLYGLVGLAYPEWAAMPGLPLTAGNYTTVPIWQVLGVVGPAGGVGLLLAARRKG